MEIIYFVSITFQKPGDLKQKKEVDFRWNYFLLFPYCNSKTPLSFYKAHSNTVSLNIWLS